MIDSAVLLAGTAVFAALAVEAGVVVGKKATPDFSRRIAACSSYSVLSVLWPSLFACLVGLDSLLRSPMLWFALVWPPALLSISVANSYQPRDGRYHAKASTQMDTNAIAGFCFAVGGLASSRLGRKVANGTGGMLAAAFLMCLAFVMPSPEIPEDDTLSVVVETVQQAFLHFAIGLLIAAILINLGAEPLAAAEREE